MRVIRILLALMLLAPMASKASHIIGGDIQYKYVGDSTGVANQYRIKLVLYRELTGIGLGTNQTVQIRSNSCNITTSVTVNLAVPEFSAATLGAYDCIPQSAATFSPMVNIYVGFVTLPTLCPDYKIYWASCCRPPGITSIPGSAGVGFYFEAELNNTITTGPKNSSPTFVSTPLSYICTGGFINYLQNAFEINGDSLQYELIPAREDWPLGSPVAYGAGYSFTNPINTTAANPFTLNQQTGNITFVANTVETSVIALRVNEYRFDSTFYVWVKVGSSNREIQVSVAGNCNAIVNAGVALDPNAPGVSLDAQGRQTKDYNCLDSSVTLLFTLDVECASVSPDGSDFRLTNPAGQPIPIKALVPNCDVNGETSTLEVKLFKPLSMNGEYYLYSKVGNDGNTLLNKCGKDMDEFDTIVLLVNDCVDLEMELTNVTINEDKHPHVYWDVDTATLPRYLFNMWRVHRSDDGGATYSIVHNSTDTNLRNWEDINIDANMVDTRVHRYFVDAIVNGFVQPSTDTVKSMWLRGDMSVSSSIPVVWNGYNAWDTAHYQVQFGRNLSGLPGAGYSWSDYGNRMQDTFALVEHPNLPPGQYAVRIKSYRHASVPTYAVDPLQDTAYSNWIEFGEPVPPIPPIDTVIVPNVITPNGDGRNDAFEIQGLMSYTTSREVTIMNRYGKVIYKNEAYDNAQPWDGKDQSGSLLADGVYFYVIKLYDEPNSASLNLSGSVTILSN
jgi:gliding motility-associated-like protein